MGCARAILGLILGGITFFALIVSDPFGVEGLALPAELDPAQRQAAYDQWTGSARVIVGSSAMTLIPLLVSGLCGVFAHGSLPKSVPASLLRMTGVASALLLVSTFGSRAIERALSTGESSDIQTPFAMLAFMALCTALAAPLSSLATPRRSQRKGPMQAEATRRGAGIAD